jgi:hypothetical protein
VGLVAAKVLPKIEEDEEWIPIESSSGGYPGSSSSISSSSCSSSSSCYGDIDPQRAGKVAAEMLSKANDLWINRQKPSLVRKII